MIVQPYGDVVGTNPAENTVAHRQRPVRSGAFADAVGGHSRPEGAVEERGVLRIAVNQDQRIGVVVIAAHCHGVENRVVAQADRPCIDIAAGQVDGNRAVLHVERRAAAAALDFEHAMSAEASCDILHHIDPLPGGVKTGPCDLHGDAVVHRGIGHHRGRLSGRRLDRNRLAHHYRTVVQAVLDDQVISGLGRRQSLLQGRAAARYTEQSALEDLDRADVKTVVQRARLAVDVHKGQVGCAGVDGRRNAFDVVTVRLHLGVLRDFDSRPAEGVAA